MTLAAVISEHVSSRPGATAIVSGNRSFTFAELDALSNSLAAILMSEGVRRGDLVAIALERRLESVALLFAISMVGAAFVPLDPSAPRRRIRQILDDARPVRVVAAKRFIGLVDRAGDRAVAIDDLVERALAMPSVRPIGSLGQLDDLAYVIYTSGTTGTPKGVMVENRAVLNTLRVVCDLLAYGPSDRVYQLATWTFDPSILQIFGTLGSGATLVLSTTDDGLDFGALADEIVDQRVTIFDTVPALLGPLLDQPRLLESSLRMVGCGGATLRGELRDRCFQRLGLAVQNHYGPTETAILATTYGTKPTDRDERVPIGAAIDGVLAYVLDADLRPVARGTQGELYLGGVCVARGYLNQPALTAARFIPDPFSPVAGARMYRTGDLVRERADGAFEFDVRIDSQVKIRGVRVELEEVEHALARHPRVSAAAAIVEGEDGNERLVAFVASSDPADALTHDLGRHAQEHLPPAARPSRIVVLDTFPTLTSGKVDLHALRKRLAPASLAATSATGDTLNDALARIWRDVLGHGTFGVDDDFFAIGGNSLAAARCAAAVAAQFGRQIPIAILFANPTILGLANVVRSNERLGLAPIVKIASGEKTPFFFMHGDYTGVGLYVRRFAGMLDPHRPIYALPPHGADGGAVPATLTAMAADHLREIRRVQPVGPYVIGGYCMGGIVAVEVARALVDAGETVAHVVAVDAHQVTPRSPLRRMLGNVRRKAPWRADREYESRAPEAVDPATMHVPGAQDRAIYAHTWQPLEIPVTFLCSEGEITDAAIERRWRRFLPRVDVRRIRGDHTTALTHYVAETCKAIGAVLERSGC